jgi:circadian clock protein KaiC
VILLDHRVTEQISTRRLRVVKYRGSTHGSNEYPFLIDRDGLTVVPITTSKLDHAVSQERVSSGVKGLDAMLDGGGYYRGSTVLLSGAAGSGKSSLAAHFANAACEAGERCLYVSYEESDGQIIRNMRSIGLDLAKHIKSGLLHIAAHRPTSFGLEGHLALLVKMAADLKPRAVVVDPIGTMASAGSTYDAHLMLVRMIDFFKKHGITVILSSLTHAGDAAEGTDTAVSSLVDTWILVKALEANGERTRGLYILKSRGMAHSNQIREFLITAHGIELRPPYVGADGVLTGTARAMQESREKVAARQREEERLRRARLLERKRALLEQRIAELRAEFDAEEVELLAGAQSAAQLETEMQTNRAQMGEMRGVKAVPTLAGARNRQKSSMRENHERQETQ